MAIIRIKPGVVTAQDGTYPELRGARKGGLVSQDVGGRYEEGAYRGAIFGVGQTSAAALTAVGTGVTGLTLFNPTGSGKNLSLLDVSVAFTPLTLATVGITVVLAGVAQAATPTGLTVLTAASTLVGGGNLPVAKTYSAATLTTAPIILRVVGNWQSTVLTTSGGATAVAALLKDEVAGAIIVPPGAVICLAGIGTVADASVIASMTWEEIPL
jgi:hypothetical protein